MICKRAILWFVQHKAKVQHGLVPSDIVQIIGTEKGRGGRAMGECIVCPEFTCALQLRLLPLNGNSVFSFNLSRGTCYAHGRKYLF